MSYIQPENREQYVLLNSLEDLVKQDNPVRIIDILTEQIMSDNPYEYAEDKGGKNEAGRPGYNPKTMMKLYIYGYMHGISSSRRLEAETKRNIELIWLLGNLRPDHWTISNYRKVNGEKIKELARQFGKFLVGNNYIGGQSVAIDGTKVKANASREMQNYKTLQKKIKISNEAIEEYLKRLKENDLSDDIEEEYEQSCGGGNIGEKDFLIRKISELQEEVNRLSQQKQDMEKQERKSLSVSDNEARLMRTREGKQAAYNVQLIVDGKNKMLVNTTVVNEENDLNQIYERIKSLKEETGIEPEEVIADKGYYNPDLIEKLEQTGIKCYVPVTHTRHEKEEIKFSYDIETGEVKCSEGKQLKLQTRNKIKKDRLVDQYRGIECSGCSKREKCTKSKGGRILYLYKNHQWREKYKKRMQEYPAKQKVSIRKTIVEHPIGTIKYLMGKIPLKLRGIKKVTTEITLYRIVYNLKRLINIEGISYLKGLMLEYQWKSD